MLLCFVFARLCHFVKVPHAGGFVNSAPKHIRKPNSSVSKFRGKYLLAGESVTSVYSEAGFTCRNPRRLFSMISQRLYHNFVYESISSHFQHFYVCFPLHLAEVKSPIKHYSSKSSTSFFVI